MKFLIEECEKIDLKTKCGFDELSLYTEPFCTNCYSGSVVKTKI